MQQTGDNEGKHNRLRNAGNRLRGSMSKLKKRIIIAICVILGVGLLYGAYVGVMLGLAALDSGNVRKDMIAKQDAALIALQEAYTAGTALKVNEQDYCTFDLAAAIADGVKMNELQYLGTHNSYKQGLSTKSYNFYKYALGNEDYIYSFPSITEQLNLGIRAFELDIAVGTKNSGLDFECSHNYLIDNCSSMIDFIKGLQEIKLWSDYNPEHLPVMLLVEVKGKRGGIFTKPRKMTLDDLYYFEELAVTTLGDTLLTLQDFKGDYADIPAMLADNGYPTIAETLGKVMIIMHPDELTNEYVAADTTATNMSLIPCITTSDLTKHPEYKTACVFSTASRMYSNYAYRNNYLLRSRLDSYPYYRPESTAKTLLTTRANMLESDYLAVCSNSDTYSVAFGDNKETIRLR